jgi:hypothetical protein
MNIHIRPFCCGISRFGGSAVLVLQFKEISSRNLEQSGTWYAATRNYAMKWHKTNALQQQTWTASCLYARGFVYV